MGLDEDTARGAQRFTLGHASTEADVDALLAALPGAYARARQAGMAGHESQHPDRRNGRPRQAGVRQELIRAADVRIGQGVRAVTGVLAEMSALMVFCGLAGHRGQLTLIPATTRPSLLPEGDELLVLQRPPDHGSAPAASAGKPEYSMLTSNWSV